jgi:hypothetical protein
VTCVIAKGASSVAAAIGLQIRVLKATTIGEIDTAFASFAQERPDALFVAADAFFATRAAQFITLTARDRIPTAYSLRDYVIAGGLMSYGADLAEAGATCWPGRADLTNAAIAASRVGSYSLGQVTRPISDISASGQQPCPSPVEIPQCSILLLHVLL